VLEVFNSICQDAALTRALYESYDLKGERDADANIFQGLVSAVGHLVQILFTWDVSKVRLISSGRAPLLDMLSLSSPPKDVPAYVVTLAVECLAGVVSSISLTIPAEDRLPIARDDAQQDRRDRDSTGRTQVRKGVRWRCVSGDDRSSPLRSLFSRSFLFPLFASFLFPLTSPLFSLSLSLFSALRSALLCCFGALCALVIVFS
jgi:hypothetical protein